MTVRRIKAVIEAQDAASPALRQVQSAVGSLRSFAAAGGAIAGVVGAAKAVQLVAQTIATSVREAAEAEVAETRRQSALARTGQLTAENAKLLDEQAKALQRVTTASDEEVASAQALLVRYGARVSQLDTLTAATLDFARATDQDLGSATAAVAKALAGSAAGLGRYGIKIGEVGSESARAAKITQQLQARFGSFAAHEGQTFQGTLTRISHSWGELHETIGKTITQSPALRSLFEQINTALVKLNTTLEGVGGEEAIKKAIAGFGSLAKAVNVTGTTAIDAGLAYKLLFDVMRNGSEGFKAFNADLQTIQDNFNRMTRINKIIDEMVATALSAKAAAPPIANIGAALEEVGTKAKESKDAFEGLFVGPITAIQQLNEELQKVPGNLTLAPGFELAAAGEAIAKAFGLVRSAMASKEISSERFALINEELVKMAEAIVGAGGVVPAFDALTVKAGKTIITLEDAVNALVEGGIGGLRQKLDASNARVETLGASLSRNLRGQGVAAAEALGDALVDAAAGGHVAWKTFLRDLLIDLTKAVVKVLIIRAVVTLAGGGSGAAVQAVSEGGIVKGRARNGLIVPGSDIGQDSVLIAARGGEGVLTPQQTRDFQKFARDGFGGGTVINIDARGAYFRERASLRDLADSIEEGRRRGYSRRGRGRRR
ncbi:MAG TPA: hypothetical protein VJS92_17595 [Candidatus Polarisedimenticolaceae bacterium]|nr:hypothetical protein [Candidatus Polarisedimenticolaceae bacterium]